LKKFLEGKLMAKNAKKITALGLGPDAFQETRIRPSQEYEHTHTHVDEHEQEYTQTHTDTHAHEHEHVQEHTHTQEPALETASVQKPKQKREPKPVEPHKPEQAEMRIHEPVARIKKERRVQWLTYDSLIQRIDAYAKERGVSRADVLEAGMEQFLSDLGR
jgi:hypothetical protein